MSNRVELKGTEEMKKNYLKYILDLVMTVVFILLMNTTVTGLKAHEVLGLGVCGLFVIHNLLNAKWIGAVSKKLFDRTFKPLTKFMFVLDAVIWSICCSSRSQAYSFSTELFSFIWITAFCGSPSITSRLTAD
jgi:hypothetical protein